MASNRLRHDPRESRVRELARALRTLSLGSGPALQEHLADLREAIGTGTGLAYSVSDTGDRLELPFMYSTRQVKLEAVRSWLAAIPRDARWAAYDPNQPERAQRNRVRVRDFATRVRRPTLALALDPASDRLRFFASAVRAGGANAISPAATSSSIGAPRRHRRE
jgi:hypothetical protein